MEKQNLYLKMVIGLFKNEKNVGGGKNYVSN